MECHDARRQGPAGRHQPLFRRRLCQGLRHHLHRTRTTSCSTPHQTSWGMSTRIIGGIIMTHGDNNGLVLPPARRAHPGRGHARSPRTSRACWRRPQSCRGPAEGGGLAREGATTRDNSPGWKFAEYEMKGVPLRLELGPQGHRGGPVCVAGAARQRREGDGVARWTAGDGRAAAAGSRAAGPLRQGQEQPGASTPMPPTRLEEVKDVIENRGGGFIKTMWCGDEACELKMKELAGVSEPLHALRAGAAGRHMPRLRPRREEDGSLGRSILRTREIPRRPHGRRGIKVFCPAFLQKSGRGPGAEPWPRAAASAHCRLSPVGDGVPDVPRVG